MLEELRSALAVVGVLARFGRNIVSLADDSGIVADMLEVFFDSFAEIFAADLQFLINLKVWVRFECS